MDQPIFPSQGVRYTASIDLAGLGGNTNFYKPMAEAVMFWAKVRPLKDWVEVENERKFPVEVA